MYIAFRHLSVWMHTEKSIRAGACVRAFALLFHRHSVVSFALLPSWSDVAFISNTQSNTTNNINVMKWTNNITTKHPTQTHTQEAFEHTQLSKHKCQNRYKQTLLIIDIIIFYFLHANKSALLCVCVRGVTVHSLFLVLFRWRRFFFFGLLVNCAFGQYNNVYWWKPYGSMYLRVCVVFFALAVSYSFVLFSSFTTLNINFEMLIWLVLL